MFKGLRAKIESEKRDQRSGVGQASSNSSPTIPRAHGDVLDLGRHLQELSATENKNSPSTSQNSTSPIPFERLQTTGDGYPSQITGDTKEECTNRLISVDRQLDQQQTGVETYNEGKQHGEDVVALQGQIARLQVQLEAVTREKDESNDQNEQLYHLIEKLRRNLETEQESKSRLQAKLNELDKQPKDRSTNGGYWKAGTSNHIGSNITFNKSFNPDAAPCMPNVSSDVQALQNEVIGLQAQLAKKVRQLKIVQQNLTDIKKALQKEIADHKKTHEELSKLQTETDLDQKVKYGQAVGKNKNMLKTQTVSNYSSSGAETKPDPSRSSSQS